MRLRTAGAQLNSMVKLYIGEAILFAGYQSWIWDETRGLECNTESAKVRTDGEVAVEATMRWPLRQGTPHNFGINGRCLYAMHESQR